MRRIPFVLLLTGTVLIALRFHALELPLETDECNYAYIGGRLLEGDRLYVDIWDHQPPGVYMLFAGTIAVFGDSPYVFRWLATAASLASMIFIHLILRSLAGPAVATWGALAFALVSSDPGTGGEGCNREIFMNALLLAGWYLAIPSGVNRRVASPSAASASGAPAATADDLPQRHASPGIWAIALSGLFIGLASLLKTNAAVYWVLLGLFLAIRHSPNHRVTDRWKNAARVIGTFAIGPAALWGSTFLYFAASGRFTDFVDAAFLFNLGYADSGEPFFSRFWRFLSPPRHPFVFESALPLWLAAAASTAWLLYKSIRRRDPAALAALLLAVSSYLAVCLPGRFWPHYYYLLIPAAVIAVGVATQDVARSFPILATRSGRFNLAGVIVGLLLLPATGWTEYRHYLSQPPMGITAKRYNGRDFWGRAQGLNLARVTDPDDRVFVFGNEAEMYYYSRRRCASRYTMITGLQTGMRGTEHRRKILMDELRSNPPRVILLLFDEPPFPDWLAFLDENYGPAVGIDRHDRSGQPIMAVFAPKDRPIAEIDWEWRPSTPILPTDDATP